MKPMWIVDADHTRTRFFRPIRRSAPLEEFETLAHEQGHNSNCFGQLIVIAEPSMLGFIRQHMPSHSSTHVGMTADDIREHLPAVLP